MAKAIASGKATIPTMTPAVRSPRNSSRLYDFSDVTSFGTSTLGSRTPPGLSAGRGVAVAGGPLEEDDSHHAGEEQAPGHPHDQTSDELILHWRDAPDARRARVAGEEHLVRVRDEDRDDRHRDRHQKAVEHLHRVRQGAGVGGGGC